MTKLTSLVLDNELNMNPACMFQGKQWELQLKQFELRQWKVLNHVLKESFAKQQTAVSTPSLDLWYGSIRADISNGK